jgi:hypothetical protein
LTIAITTAPSNQGSDFGQCAVTGEMGRAEGNDLHVFIPV